MGARLRDVREKETDLLNQRIENLRGDIERQQAKNETLEAQNENIREGMPLRERIKEIFKKHGLTVFSVLTAVSVIIGAIVSNLKKGLATFGKGLGNDLKTVGKILGEILPGIVGAIASFIFKTAGQVIQFLGKNAWLLIVAAVMYTVEQFKKNRS